MGDIASRSVGKVKHRGISGLDREDLARGISEPEADGFKGCKGGGQ